MAVNQNIIGTPFWIIYSQILIVFLCRLELFGKNEVIVEVHSYWKLFFAEVLNPFYVFQIFSICLWCFDDYEYYGLCVLISSAFSIGTSLYQLKQVWVIIIHVFRWFELATSLCSHVIWLLFDKSKWNITFFVIMWRFSNLHDIFSCELLW